jgi:hypothetical protein
MWCLEMTSKQKKVTGRPPKFQEERRPITVTLPERTLKKLTAIAEDRARAIVQAVDSIVPDETATRDPVDLIEVYPGQALIVVGPSKMLKKIPWLQLVEIAPSRYLLSVPSGTPIESLELALIDLLDHLPVSDSYERRLLSTIREKLNTVRREQRISKAEILFVATK